MSKLINNIERRMKRKGLTQKALALRAGLNETAVRDILKGRSKDPQFSTLNGLARVLGCPVEALFTESRPKYGMSDPGSAWPADVGVEAEGVTEETGELSVDELDIADAAAPATISDGRRQRVISRWQLPRDTVESFAGNNLDLKIVRVQGDSMAPDFMPGDRVMVNLVEKTPSPPGVFLLWDGSGFVLRRCEMRAGAKPARVLLRARNADYGSHEAALKDIAIAGRVVGKWQKV